MAVRKQVLYKKASLGITVSNPFGEYVKQQSTAYGPNFDQANIWLVPLRSFGITLSHKFGKLELKKNKEDDNTPQEPAYN